jgi:multiple sugar transport system permease protein
MSPRARQSLVSWLVVGPFAIVLAFPFYWMLMTSLKTNGDLYDINHNPFVFNAALTTPNEDQPLRGQGWLPLGIENVTTHNYSFLFTEPGIHYLDWIKNTLVVGGIVVLITLALSLPAGYALARLSGAWGQSAGIGIFLVYLVPPTLLFLPLSRVVAELGFQDRLTSLILVYPSFTVPFSTWLLMGFFKTIPPELEDAALVDGASRLKALTRVVLPLSLPGILTVVIFSFSLCVNEFIYAVTFISTSDARTISTGVPLELIRGDVFFWQSLMAATLIPSIPLALLYNVFLDRFIAGFTGGAFR